MTLEQDSEVTIDAKAQTPTAAAISRWQAESRIRNFFGLVEATYGFESSEMSALEQRALRMVAENLLRKAAPNASPAEKKGLLAHFSVETVVKELNHTGLFELLVQKSIMGDT